MKDLFQNITPLRNKFESDDGKAMCLTRRLKQEGIKLDINYKLGLIKGWDQYPFNKNWVLEERIGYTDGQAAAKIMFGD